MSISFDNERLLTLRDAAKSLPPSKNGKHVHIATIHRWAGRGLRGVRLETIRVGGRTCTSAEALQRFFDRLGAPDEQAGDARSDLAGTPGASQPRRSQLEKELREEGL